MLWIVNQNGVPCRQARFVKVGHQGLFIVLNRSTISIHDVESMLAGGQTVILNAVQVIFTGAQPNDYVGPEVVVVDTGMAVAKELKRRLQVDDLSTDSKEEGKISFFTSGIVEDQQILLSRWWGEEVPVLHYLNFQLTI